MRFNTVLIKFTFNVTIHSLKTIERNADPDVQVNYDIISHEVQTSDFQHIAVKSIGKLNMPAFSFLKTANNLNICKLSPLERVYNSSFEQRIHISKGLCSNVNFS